uniref:Uncharacterized protein n=1 Tax=Ciona savignyi TaxID=51511 RepID=H2YVC4_CIOSA
MKTVLLLLLLVGLSTAANMCKLYCHHGNNKHVMSNKKCNKDLFCIICRRLLKCKHGKHIMNLSTSEETSAQIML